MLYAIRAIYLANVFLKNSKIKKVNMGSKLLLKLSSILNFDNNPKRVFLFCFVFYSNSIFKPLINLEISSYPS